MDPDKQLIYVDMEKIPLLLQGYYTHSRCLFGISSMKQYEKESSLCYSCYSYSPYQLVAFFHRKGCRRIRRCQSDKVSNYNRKSSVLRSQALIQILISLDPYSSVRNQYVASYSPSNNSWTNNNWCTSNVLMCKKEICAFLFPNVVLFCCVCVIYIYSSIRVIHPKRFFFRQTRLMAESPWPKRPNASPWLQLVVMEALDIWRDPSSHPWRHDLTKIMGERWQLTPFWLFWKEKPPLQKHPTCLYNWRIKYRSMNKNEKFINVCWQLLHLTPYPKFA